MIVSKLFLCLILVLSFSCKSSKEISSKGDFFVIINPVTKSHLEIRLVPKGKGEALLSRSGYFIVAIDGDNNTPSFASSSVGKLFSNGSGKVFESYTCIPSKDKIPRFFSHNSKISYLEEMIIKPDFKSNQKGKYKFNLRTVCSIIYIDQPSIYSSNSRNFTASFSIDIKALKKGERLIIDPDWQVDSID